MGGSGVEIANAYLALRVRMPGAQRDIAAGLRGGARSAESAGREAGDKYAGGVERSLGSRAGSMFKRVAAAGVAAIGSIAVASATVGFKTAAGMETANIAFTTMLGSADAAKKMLGDLSAFAAKTPFDLPGLQRSAQSLISIGIDADKVIPIMTTLGNVTSGMGTGAEGVQRATVAIQQMNAAGRITAEDLNQLRDAGVPVFDLLTAATGRTTEEIAAMAQSGGLGRKELEALMKALESGKGLERFNGMMEKQSTSLTGLWSTLKDTFSVGMAEAVQPLIPMLKDGLAGAIDLVAKAMPHVQNGLKWLVSAGPSIGAWIGDAATKVKEFFSETFKGDGAGETFKSIGDSASMLAPVIKAGADALPSFNDALSVTDTVMSFLADNSGTLAALMPLLVGAFIAWKGAQLASNLIGRDSVIGMGVQTISTLSLAASNRALVASNAQVVAAQTGVTAAENVGLMTRIRMAAATVAHRAATLGVSIATRAAAAGQWLLNAAMSANPLGLIIAGIAAVVAALVWFFTQTELGREIWANVTKAIATAATWLWENVLQPVFKAIGDVFRWIWENIFRPIGTLIVNYFRFWGAVAVWLWKTVLQPVFAAIGKIFEWIWKTIIQPIIGFIGSAIQGLGKVFTWLWQNVVKPTWEGISKAISTAWNWIDRNVFSPFKVGIDLIQKGFEGAARGIGTAWAGIKRAAANPINFVLETVWNNGIRSFWNGLVDTLGLKDMRLPRANSVRFAKGGVLPGYTPGRDVFDFLGPGGMHLALSGGEGILVPQAVRALGGARGINAINSQARSGALSGDGIGDVFGDVWEFIKGAANVAWDFLSNPAGAIEKHIIGGIIKPLVSGENIFGKTAGGVAGNFMRGFTDLLKSAAPEVSGSGMGWEKMWGIVKSQFPWATLNSAYRAGAVTATGGQSYHGLGRAIDTTASMEIFNWLAKTFPNSRELIYSPAGNRQLLNGARHFYDGAVRQMHFNHVHWAMKHGGVLPGLYDEGGWLPHGGMALNLSGSPERVLSPSESADYDGNGKPRVMVVFQNPVTRDPVADAWEAAAVVEAVS